LPLHIPIPARSDDELFLYKLLCAITDPAKVNYIYGVSSFTCPEKCYFISINDADIGAYARPHLNLPTLSVGSVGLLPPIAVLDVGEVLSFALATTYGAAYVKESDVLGVSNPVDTFYSRLKYLTKTIPTRYKIVHTAINELIELPITVTNKAILGSISLRAIYTAQLEDRDDVGATYFIHSIFRGIHSGASGTRDYVFHTYKPLFPLKPISGHTWCMWSRSAAQFFANGSNCYFEVFNNLPSPPWE